MATTQEVRTTRQYIGGEWVDGRSTFDVEDPYDGTLVLPAPAGTREDDRRGGGRFGDPKDPATVVGPLITRGAAELVEQRVAEAVAAGARLLVGGGRDGSVYRPTLLADVPPETTFAREETFGPVAAVELVDDAEHALAVANATTYGLSAGILTRDLDAGLALAQRLDAGCVHVNDQSVHDEPQMPLGGMKESGWGRFGGRAVVDEFTELHWISVQSGTREFPF